MSKTIIANVMPEETRVAIIEKGQLAEFAIERSENGHIVGNIYKGKVKNILPGMQAAFVDIGRDKNAFLYLGDLLPRYNKGDKQQAQLTVGQEIMVQIVKDAMGTKGPRVTTQITLPGRYVVLMPTVEYTGVSRRIEDEKERERLRQATEQVKPASMGVIVRTVAEGRSEEDIRKDIAYLLNFWTSLSAREKRTSAPALLYRDVDLVIRIVRDYLSPDVSEVVLDSREAYNRICDLLEYGSPEMIKHVTLYERQEEIFSHYAVAEEIEQIGKRIVHLKCGGYIVIDHTEALTVIDVNTGKFTGRTSLSDTVFQANLEAASEIARQIRLRDIGGIIIIDFIDMDKEEQKKAVLAALERKVKEDRTKTNILGLTGLGLVEMTRKKARQNIDQFLYSECPCCQGRGRIQSPDTIAVAVLRKLRHLATRRRVKGSLIVQVHPRVAEVLLRPGEKERLEQELARTITIEGVASIHAETFSILSGKD